LRFHANRLLDQAKLWLERARVLVTGAPKRPVPRFNCPRLTYGGPPIVRSDAERLADILAPSAAVALNSLPTISRS
jgi:hypothetical protein